jgi:hypothetical protein
MATFIATISAYEVDYRCECAVAALANGKKVTLAPGFFKAADISPKRLMDKLLSYLYIYELELAQQELYANSYDTSSEGSVDIRQWRVFITRRPKDLSFVIEATCFD